MNGAVSIVGKDLSKKFAGKRAIFSDVHFQLSNSEILGITGNNGAGKSTLLKIIAGQLSASSGSIERTIGTKAYDSDDFLPFFSYVAPYLNLYEEFSPLEHLQVFAKIRNQKYDKNIAFDLLQQFGIFKARNQEIATFSSGMKQRMKFVIALISQPKFLFLDEPTSNLDENGIKIVEKTILNFQKSAGGIIIATNEEREKALCGQIISLNSAV